MGQKLMYNLTQVMSNGNQINVWIDLSLYSEANQVKTVISFTGFEEKDDVSFTFYDYPAATRNMLGLHRRKPGLAS